MSRKHRRAAERSDKDGGRMTTAPDTAARAPECRVDTSRHPLMHVTPTTDYIMLLEGEVSLLLDRGDPIPLRSFDAIVQRGTNHTWLVTGSSPAVFLAVMAGSY